MKQPLVLPRLPLKTGIHPLVSVSISVLDVASSISSFVACFRFALTDAMRGLVATFFRGYPRFDSALLVVWSASEGSAGHALIFNLEGVAAGSCRRPARLPAKVRDASLTRMVAALEWLWGDNLLQRTDGTLLDKQAFVGELRNQQVARIYLELLLLLIVHPVLDILRLSHLLLASHAGMLKDLHAL
mmetsp:Transcript_81042/g.161099  ORF Transcript_81042/g.161099 Transcript_81042/m.161099 type:complete len:187 (-) Transcript_81042:382-942(-)